MSRRIEEHNKAIRAAHQEKLNESKIKKLERLFAAVARNIKGGKQK